MLSVAEYRSRILAQVRAGEPVELPLREARGRVLALDLVSAVDLPGFDNSAMDGYAVVAADVEAATPQTPVTLPVSGDIPAGDRAPRTLAAGRAWRIMTGAPVPEGADTVVQVEHTDGGVEQVRVHQPADPGRHIRRRGEDVRAGDVIVPAGRVLGTRELALAAAAGCGTAVVLPTPKVLILSTGDELVPVGHAPGFGEVVDSNGAMLQALCDSLGVESVRVGGVEDTPEAVVAALAEGARAGCDAVVTTGGVSMGAYDAVKEALSTRGVAFEQVSMKPGKPQGFGRVRLDPDATDAADTPDLRVGLPVFTLPGNPVSAYVSFYAFVLPALQLMAGGEPAGLPSVRVRVEGEQPRVGGRTQFVRVSLRRGESGEGGLDGRAQPTATLLRGQGSHMLQGLANADGLLEIPSRGELEAAGAAGTADEPATYRCFVLSDTSALLPEGGRR